ncbi:MAG: hypothetical protein KGJ13_04640 [Patescibacteria group bacterium]|nr:hypothetical protein [Patescibacteria group bacterium]
MSFNGFGLPQHEPGLVDLLNVFEDSIYAKLNCVKIGQIQSFDAAAKTASIQVMFQRVLRNGGYQNYPVLVDCPVLIAQGGGASLQFPVSKGDWCLLLFCDRNIDAWFTTGTAQPPPDGRMHDISDAIAIIGLCPQPSAIVAPDSSESRLIGTAGEKVGIKGGLVTIQNSSQNLLTALNNLLTALESLTVTVSGSTGTVSAATVTQLQAVGTQLSALLY